MKYLCLVYHEENKLNALSQDELDALVGDCIAWTLELERSGRHIFSAGLQSFRGAATVRDRHGNLSITDGPFAETKEYLGGFTLLSARDLNEAIQLASRLPAARIGSIEVRPILEPDVELTDALDQKIGAAIRRKTPPVDPSVTARMASIQSVR
ncbi:MAG TPA: YciI family protein [Gemmataceae bacterium]|nr:YciI family protein [Gemmataceae bacterium]